MASSKNATMAAEVDAAGPRVPSPVHTIESLADIEQGLPLQTMQPVSESGDGLRLTQGQEERLSTSTTSTTQAPVPSVAHPKGNEAAKRLPRITWQRIKKKVKFGRSAEETKRLWKQRGYDRFKNRQVDDYPEGLPRLAALLSSDPDLTIFRSFNYVHCRILLQSMTEMSTLEEKLFKLDHADAKHPILKERLRHTMFKEGDDTEQRDLLEELHTKITKYDDLMLKYNQIQALGQTSTRNHRSVWHWYFGHKPLRPRHDDCFLRSDDFISVRHRETNYFEDAVQNYLNWSPGTILKKFCKTKIEHKKTTDKNVNYYSPERVRIIGRLLTVFVANSLLFISVFILFLIPMSRVAMVMTAFCSAFFFCLVVSIVANTKVHETFFLAATYAALLIVFLGATDQSFIIDGAA